ncbi:MAG: hypothetical protein GY811_07600 [Myxococcales bacterium]|nr:hypothetical protein [Myxococcales bacterium]
MRRPLVAAESPHARGETIARTEPSLPDPGAETSVKSNRAIHEGFGPIQEIIEDNRATVTALL